MQTITSEIVNALVSLKNSWSSAEHIRLERIKYLLNEGFPLLEATASIDAIFPPVDAAEPKEMKITVELAPFTAMPTYGGWRIKNIS